MKTYKVTETYSVTHVIRVIAPDAEAAKAWGVHPKTFVLDHGKTNEDNHKSVAEEET